MDIEDIEDIEENKYTPVEANYYDYKAKIKLEVNVDNFIMSNKIKKINICSYQVNNDGKLPFLKFLLTRDICDNTLNFPYLPIYDNLNTEQIINFTKIFIFGLLLLDNFDNFNNNIEFNGFYEFENELYLFINLTACNININDIYYDTPAWFVLIDEMLNQRHVCNIMIDPFVTRFFNDNYDFCLLIDKKGLSYEIPFTCYVGGEDKMLNFIYTFGVSKKDKTSILGPYYYFTNFITAVKEECLKHNLEIKNRSVKSGIIRFAVFSGVTKYIENFPNDVIDESEIKKQLIKDAKLNDNYECLTMRISDHDGKWTELFDSCYLGNHIELDNGEYLKNAPLLVVKEYNQQIPLSYHYINKSHLKEKYDENHEYAIL